MKKERKTISYSDLYAWYCKIYDVLEGKNYHNFLKEECGIDLFFGNGEEVVMIVEDEKKYLVSKLKYGF